jgi:uracil phosphoribosyltransferase
MSPSEEAPQKGVGPDYKQESEKPKATISKDVEHSNVTVLPQTSQLISLLT